MFLRTSGKRPLTSVGMRLAANHSREGERIATLANGHRGDDALNGIFSFIAVFAVEVDAELVVFAFAGTSNAHGGREEIWSTAILGNPISDHIDFCAFLLLILGSQH